MIWDIHMDVRKSQDYQSLEKLDHKKVMEEHIAQFDTISKSLEEFYRDYKNREKIINLLNAWMYLLRSLYESYGIEGVKSYLQSDFSCTVRFSWFYECDVNIRHRITTYKSNFFFKLLNGFLSHALLPGARVRSLYSKFRWRFAKFIILNIPRNIIAERQRIIIDIVMDYFSNYSTDFDEGDLIK